MSTAFRMRPASPRIWGSFQVRGPRAFARNGPTHARRRPSSPMGLGAGCVVSLSALAQRPDGAVGETDRDAAWGTGGNHGARAETRPRAVRAAEARDNV